jgi:hypothetical protein
MKDPRYALTALAVATTVAWAHGGGHDGDVFVEVAQVRKATVRFHAIEQALAAGYAQFQSCVDEPGEGAMGIHFVNGSLVGDTVVDALRPEALMYEQGNDGRMRLVGVEYIVFQDAWDAENEAPPTLFGETFHRVDSPNRYGIPAFYALHAWVWRHNPVGTFYDWNPKVRCPGDVPDASYLDRAFAPIPRRASPR